MRATLIVGAFSVVFMFVALNYADRQAVKHVKRALAYCEVSKNCATEDVVALRHMLQDQ